MMKRARFTDLERRVLSKAIFLRKHDCRRSASPHPFPGELRDDGLVSRLEWPGAEGQFVAFKAVVANLVATNPEGKEAGLHVMDDGLSLDGIAAGVGDVSTVAALPRGG